MSIFPLRPLEVVSDMVAKGFGKNIVKDEDYWDGGGDK